MNGIFMRSKRSNRIRFNSRKTINKNPRRKMKRGIPIFTQNLYLVNGFMNSEPGTLNFLRQPVTFNM